MAVKFLTGDGLAKLLDNLKKLFDKKLDLSGGQMSGPIDMNGSYFTNVRQIYSEWTKTSQAGTGIEVKDDRPNANGDGVYLSVLSDGVIYLRPDHNSLNPANNKVHLKGGTIIDGLGNATQDDEAVNLIMAKSLAMGLPFKPLQLTSAAANASITLTKGQIATGRRTSNYVSGQQKGTEDWLRIDGLSNGPFGMALIGLTATQTVPMVGPLTAVYLVVWGTGSWYAISLVPPAANGNQSMDNFPPPLFTNSSYALMLKTQSNAPTSASYDYTINFL